MTLLEVWRTKAYGDQLSKEEQEKLWKDYFLVEKGIYEKLLADVSKVERGTVKELAEKYGTDIQTMTGFLDGISESLKQDIPTETMDENTEIVLEIDPEKLYYNMVEAKAEWLYGLEAWDHISERGEKKRAVPRAEAERYDSQGSQGRQKRSLPLRFRQEVQILLRQKRISLAPLFGQRRAEHFSYSEGIGGARNGSLPEFCKTLRSFYGRRSL